MRNFTFCVTTLVKRYLDRSEVTLEILRTWILYLLCPNVQTYPTCVCLYPQLTEANQRWSTEWDKLQKHYDDRIRELELDRNQLEKETTDQKLAEDTKLRDYEKMLMVAKNKKEDEEVRV